jgi:DnaJ like chaperone protein
MSDLTSSLKALMLFVPRNFGKIIGGLIGMFWAKNIFAFAIGILLGHQFDRGLSGTNKSPFAGLDKMSGSKRVKFIRVFFNVMGHIAKADGRVTEEEIRIARGLMAELKLSKDEQSMAIRAFTEGKNPEFPLAHTLNVFFKDFRNNIALREWFVRLQIQAALAGDGISKIIDNLLHATAAQLDIPKRRVVELVREAQIFNSFAAYGRKTRNSSNYYQRQKYSRYSNEYDENFARQKRSNYRRTQRPSRPNQNDLLAEAYILLGVSAADSSKDITRAYRRLLSQHHPDKMIGRGAGKAEREFANAKTIEIRKAFELIKERRNL